uniref:Reverse transcriptase domain-containing protein n=1 Tax=Cannabis sativa TaxID=3483 RepID=A0A803PLI3_CANSA
IHQCWEVLSSKLSTTSYLSLQLIDFSTGLEWSLIPICPGCCHLCNSRGTTFAVVRPRRYFFAGLWSSASTMEDKYRVDNYEKKCSSEVYLMDLKGKVLFTIRKKKLQAFGGWVGYRCYMMNISTEEKPWFRVTRQYCKMLMGDLACHISVGCDDKYRIVRIAGKAVGFRIVNLDGKIVAEAKQKQSSSGVVLGDDVLSLEVAPCEDHSLIMALVMVYGLIHDDEVRKALFQMHPDKSPGPDGMTPGFFQKYWHVVGQDVISQVKQFFVTGSFPHALNETNIVLVPKKKQPETMSDLRPISLCNVLYKRKRMGKEGFMALKLKLSKAYDRVEWMFLEQMMLQMGLSREFVSLIMACVSTVKYKITHGGHNLGPIIPSRGIRQGDPLSPYLFLICAEGFSSSVQRYVQNRWLSGCRVARGAPIISHMLFADDSYVYCKANGTEAANVLHLLSVYERASGQKVNFDKSSVFFSNNTRDDVREYICNFLGVSAASENSTYLGLPCTMGRSKKAILGFLKEKMRKKIQRWETRFLSKAGKEVLVKSVAQSLPSFAMTVFLLTKEICTQLEGMMAKFWWKSQSNSSSKGVSWMSWNKLSHHKDVGGLGFRNLRDYNLAFLGKQGWRLLTNENSLVSKLYKARYFPNGDFLSSELGSNPSFIWRSIWEAKSLVKMGARRAIGDGKLTGIIGVPWLPGNENQCITTVHPSLVGRNVDCLMKMEGRGWDEELVNDIFNAHDRNLILSIQLSDTPCDDCWYWSKESASGYSVRSSYKMLQQQNGSWPTAGADKKWQQLWLLDIPGKVKHMLWRALSGCLPTKVQLDTKHVNVDLTCPLCHVDIETIFHVLMQCDFAKSCWNISAIDFKGGGGTPDFANWFGEALLKDTSTVMEERAMIAWRIWLARNDILWSNKTTTVYEVVQSTRTNLDSWKNAQVQRTAPLLNVNHSNGREHWMKPMKHKFKINVDGAIFEAENCFGIGCVIRDQTARLVEAISISKHGGVTPEIAEAIGVKEALS